MRATTALLIKKYYDAYNAQDWKTFFDLLDENIVHDINQGGQELGKKAFEKFMEHMNECYKENVSHLVVMSNETGTHAAAEFQVDGVYIKTDGKLPAAKHQKYSITAGAFFEVKDSKITRVTTYYNLKEWIKLVS
jgi:steroid delta-isomerase-like uncharacterized protein